MRGALWLCGQELMQVHVALEPGGRPEGGGEGVTRSPAPCLRAGLARLRDCARGDDVRSSVARPWPPARPGGPPPASCPAACVNPMAIRPPGRADHVCLCGRLCVCVCVCVGGRALCWPTEAVGLCVGPCDSVGLCVAHRRHLPHRAAQSHTGSHSYAQSHGAAQSRTVPHRATQGHTG